MFKKLLTIFSLVLTNINNIQANDSIHQQYSQQIKQIEKYFNNTNSFSADFVQIAQNNIVNGTIYLQKPGKIRFEYHDPSPITIVANGKIVTYFDEELDEISHIPSKKTPVKFLAQKKLSLTNQDFEIIDFSRTR